MKKFVCSFFAFFITTLVFSQSNLSWKSYSSYNEIKDISEANDKVYAASQNAIFTRNQSSAATTTLTTVEGLSGETISHIYFSKAFNKTLIGYENGLIIVVNPDGSMFNAIGIIQKQIPGNIKKVNNFMEHNGIVYVSCDFGIVQFFLNNSEFGDTYFLGSTISDYQKVIQTTVFNNSIYAVTQNNGIKKGDLSNPNLNDFSQWSVFNVGNWNGIATINNQLVASGKDDNNLYRFTGNSAFLFHNNIQAIVDFRVNENNLIVTTASRVVVFNNSLTITTQIDNTAIMPVNPVFSCATIINNVLNIGTKDNGVYTKTNTSNFINITPNCPIRNVIFNVKSFSSGFYAVYGGYDGNFNPYAYDFGGLNNYGFSKYTENGWKNIPSAAVLGAKNLTRITINPKNEKQVYLSSFFSGVLKVENDVPTTLYNQTNSTLETLVDPNSPNPLYIDIRINGAAFDKSGSVWFGNSRIKNAIKRLRPDNTWQSISIAPISANSFFGYLGNDYSNLLIDKNNIKWLASSQDGIIAYNDTNNVLKKITSGAGNGNLPSQDVRAIAIDNKNQMWIGTAGGLRILPSVDNFNQAGQMNTNSIIILENGIAQELMYEQFITDIVVDGSNRKWISTNNQGVFLLSPNGQSTIYHFTTNNSPLPSNSVLDLDINGTTGEVLMATIKGMVSFKGISTAASSSLENAYVYPNPVRPEYTGTVKISGLLDKANVKITDIEGNLVFETTSEGGTVEWDTTAFGKYKVASGVYMIFLSGSDGEETKVKKVMIVR